MNRGNSENEQNEMNYASSSPNKGRLGGVVNFSKILNCLPTPSLIREGSKKVAFTLAEVLITLGIIGVVAAMTMPVMINNIKYHSYDNARNKILNSVGEAGRILAIEGDIAGAVDAENFVKNRLSKKLSIAKMCDSAHLTDCGLPNRIFKTDGKTEIDMPTKMMNGTAAHAFDYSSDDTKIYARKNSYGFVTANGYSVNLFYNGACEPNNFSASQYPQNLICFFAIYDMNGLRKPNTVGKDIGFIGVYYPNEENHAVAVLPADYGYSSAGRGQNQTSIRFASAANVCEIQFGKDYRLPDRDELSLMSLCGNLIMTDLGAYWSSTMFGTGYAWEQHFYGGHRRKEALNNTSLVYCVRR